MPFTEADAIRHNRSLEDSPRKRRQWVEVANSVLQRCMADGGSDASCAPGAIRQANGVVAAHEMSIHWGSAVNYTITDGVHGGKTHMVIPVVMMVQGVHRGSHGPILHLADELGRYPNIWDGIPVVINHPQVDGVNVPASSPDILDQYMVGRVFNTRMEDQKLKAEVWLDPELMQRISPQAADHIAKGKPMDVSIGVFTDEDMTTGEYGGERYEAIARNHRPDHLALLPGGVGACSWVDGCGLRAHSATWGGDIDDPEGHSEGESEMKTDPIKFNATSEEIMSNEGLKGLASMGIMVNAMGYQETAQAIQAKLDRMDDPPDKVHYLEECYDNYFVFRVSGRDGSSNYFKRNYTVANDGAVEFTGEASPVIKRVSYDPVSTQGGMRSMTKKPCCVEKVEMLIQTGLYGESDRDQLLTMEEAVIDMLVASAEKAQATQTELQSKVEALEADKTRLESDKSQIEANAAKDNTSREQAIETLREDLGDKDKFLSLASPEIRSTLEHAMKLHAKEREENVKHILANTNEGVYTKEGLEAMDDKSLDDLARAIKAPRNYEGRGPTPDRTPQTNEDYAVYPPDVKDE